jgi:hypothetical protein
MRRAGRLGDGWLISFAEHLLELKDKVAVYKAIAAEHARPSTLCLMRDVHIVPSRDQLDPAFLPNIITVWQSYDNLGSKADRDELSNEVMFRGRQVSLENFPQTAPWSVARRLLPRDGADPRHHRPEWFFITPTGVPDPEQQIRELRLFAKEVMPHFQTA